jgi:quinol monooxygenase YgiN
MTAGGIDMAIHVVAKSVVPVEKQEEYKVLAQRLVEMTRKEKGCISYSLYQEKDDPEVLTFLEVWQDKEHLEAHSRTSHFTEIVPELEKIREKGEVNIYTEIK